MFAGTYHHTLDRKNRIVIPSKLRSEIPSDQKGFYISLWQLRDTRCLSLFTRAAWQERMLRLDKEGEKDEEADAYLTMLSSKAEPADADPEWRIVIPEKLLASVQVGREVVLVGRIWQVLIMRPEDWKRFDEDLVRSYPDVYRRLQRTQRSP